MIRLYKSAEPAILAANEAVWTAVILQKKAVGQEPTPTELSRYRHPEIKTALLEETHGKCAYCESKFEHISYGDVEHISPKSLDPGRMFKWDNLTLACDVCNTNKGNKFPDGAGLVDPYKCTPSGHFQIHGPLVFAVHGDDDARLTEETLKLNRAALVEKRQQKIYYLRDQIEVIMRAPDRLRNVLVENLKLEIHYEQEYSAIAYKYLEEFLILNLADAAVS